MIAETIVVGGVSPLIILAVALLYPGLIVLTVYIAYRKGLSTAIATIGAFLFPLVTLLVIALMPSQQRADGQSA